MTSSPEPHRSTATTIDYDAHRACAAALRRAARAEAARLLPLRRLLAAWIGRLGGCRGRFAAG